MRLVVASLLACLPLAAQELPTPVRVEEPAPKPETRTIRVFGSVAAIDQAGIRHERESGKVLLFHPAHGTFAAEVKEGRFEAFVSSAESLVCVDAELAERSVAVEREWIAPPFEQAIELEGRWIEPIEVDVVADEDGKALAGIEVRHWSLDQGVDLFELLREPERPDSPRFRSPLKLARRGDYWIRAPGRAWARIRWEDESVSQEQIRLPLAGSLVVELEELAGAKDVALSIRHDGFEGEAIVVPPDAVSARVTLDGLPPGRADVTALLDFAGKSWINHEITLGCGNATITTDVAAHAKLKLAARPTGLHPDGTVDRTGFVTLPGVIAPRRSASDGWFTYLPMERVMEQESTEPEVGEAGSDVVEREAFWAPLWKADGADRSSYEPLRAEIRAGQFAVRVPFGCWLVVQSLHFDGGEHSEYEAVDGDPDDEHERAWAFESTREPVELAIPAGAMPLGAPLDLLLHVVDRETRGELTRVKVALATPRSWNLHPGPIAPEELLLDDGHSPFHPPVPRGGLHQTGWIGAEGYCWSSLDFSAVGEETIELERGADLAITFEGARPPESSVVRLRPVQSVDDAVLEMEELRDPVGDEASATADSMDEEVRHGAEAWIASLRDGSADPDAIAALGHLAEMAFPDASRLELSGVPRGLLLVSVEYGADSRSLAWTLVDTTPGGRLDVPVRVPEIAVPAAVPLRGTIDVPLAWGIAPPRLLLRPRDVPFLLSQDERDLARNAVRADEQQPGRFAWDAGSLLPGTWEIGLRELAWHVTVELVAPGLEELALVLPPPADCVVHLVDETTGGAARVAQLHWSCGEWDEGGGWWEYTVGPDYGTPSDRFEFRAPLGTLQLAVMDGVYEYFNQAVTLHPGRNEITLQLDREWGVALRLNSVEELDRLVWLLDWVDDIALARADGTRAVVSGYTAGDRLVQLFLEESGRFRVLFPPLPGFKPIAPFEVDVRKGEFTEVAIELVRVDDKGDRDR